ncbi:ATP-dependent nuclease [Rhizobium herbae]|uniref:Energy-coupling factor transporter ATP-binding protein EcfA2 n=1 Tax=Rhizobium herbae TaxID=508661 RepID=A0ABS4EJT6_9HYPH|nr:ATP-binding protein [Rhizobium herbae]MBP1858196.1 energy-coupling factor transporter ATP-binding protein EcfA2 [Rhizobium herbae]
MLHQFTNVEFSRFKAFRQFNLKLKHFNILVGPNNAGKSTILAAFRILAAAMRKASARKATLVRGPGGMVTGYEIDLSTISVAEENIFYNYDDDEAASVKFTLSNQNSLTLYFPEQGICHLLPDAQGKHFANPSDFGKHFNAPIGFVPILGPVDHHEQLYAKEAARLALFSYIAARNFRNIWHHFPEKFDEFRSLLQETWPGMDIQRPEIDRSHDKPRLHMYCPENRLPRELFWAGFGFQVWCQMLTHVIQSSGVSLFLIDEPDIYLHSELQRQLLGILRNLGPDILLATHSTEMISEAETNDIILINKGKTSGSRIKDPSQLSRVFNVLGSNLNPILTQLAKTRRVVFVEGKDFQIIGKFARKLGQQGIGNRRDFAVVPVEGFNPERIRNLKAGMETTLGGKISAAAILDRDYRSDEERQFIIGKCEEFCDIVVIHKCKEIENFLLVISAINRAIEIRLKEQAKRSGRKLPKDSIDITSELISFCEESKSYISAQYITSRTRFDKEHRSGSNEAKLAEIALTKFEADWKSTESRLRVVPGKDALSVINKYIGSSLGISITETGIIDAMQVHEVPAEMVQLIQNLEEFCRRSSE